MTQFWSHPLYHPRAVNVEAKTPFLFARGRKCALRDVIWILHWLLMERRLTANLRLIMGNLLCKGCGRDGMIRRYLIQVTYRVARFICM
jgi:hypothetical protein